MKETCDPSQRLILLIASRRKLEEMTFDSEIGSTLSNVIGSRWSPAGWLGRQGLSYAKRHVVNNLKRLSDVELFNMFNRSLNLGFPVAWYGHVEAKKDFDFGVGHIPSDGSFYLQHPINTQSYISPNDFSRTICSEKEVAFLRLAASLGAKSIQLTSIQTNDTTGVFSSKLKAPEVAASLGFRAKFDKSGNVIKEVVKEFNKPSFARPYVPEQLAGWVDFDPDLRIMASDRMEANVAKSHVKLEFSQSLGLGGELSAKIADRGLSVGGTFKSMARSIWSFEVEYFDLQ